MASFNQYYKGIYYYTRAALIYRSLRSYLKKDFSSDLNFPNQLKEDYFYHQSYYNRTKQYMNANHFFGELLCLLRGKPIRKEERMRFANLSSCAPIFDDFFEKGANLDHVFHLLKNPSPQNVQNESEELAVIFLNNILNSLSQKTEFLESSYLLFQAQSDSKSQNNQTLSKQELLDISLRKGGYSGLMYAHLLDDSKEKYFLEIAYLLGGLGQLMDDIFDIYDDAKEGIRTFANQSENLKEIREIIHNQIQEIRQRFPTLSKENYQLYHFSNVLEIFITTIEIALQHYDEIEAKHKINPHQCLQLDRKLWIVDMEKPANIWHLFQLSLSNLK
ncbi:MAG: hypothetical protein GQ527_10900 [Bacteroidales bacterium]|nr:hypothetical protein [Bacteroidales bacterium]